MRRTAVLVAAAAAASVAGCGEDQSYSNEPRPAAPIVLTASITKDEVSVSPEEFGAGAVSLVVANQTSAAQEITFETSGSSAGFRQQTGPINPGDTATLKANVESGKLTVRVQSDGIQPAELTVGDPRPSAQDDLLQP